MPERQIASIRNAVCALCLSVNRKLYCVKREKLAFLLSIKTMFDEEKICWECNTMIRKLSSFRVRAFHSQNTLLTIYKKLDVSKDNTLFEIESTSRLVHSKVTTYSLEPELQKTYDEDVTESPSMIIIKQEVDDGNETLDPADDGGETISLKPEIIHSEEDPLTYHQEIYKEATIVKTEELDEEEICSKPRPAKRKNELKLDGKSDVQYNIEIEPAEENDSPLFGSTETLPETSVKLRELRVLTGKCAVQLMSKEEMLQSREDCKRRRKYRAVHFKCDKCVKIFLTGQDLDEHLLKHSDDFGPFSCDICEQRFKTLNLALDHKSTHYTRYVCSACDKDMYDPNDMWEHYDYTHKIAPKPCGICGVTFMTRYLQIKHRKQRHKGKPTCDICGITTADFDALKEHVLNHTDVPEQECPVCFKKYLGYWGLQAHVRWAHDEKKAKENLFCAKCNHRFSNYKDYREHLTRTLIHGPEQKVTVKCRQCGKRFLSEELKKHYAAEHAEQHKCEICGKAYNWKKSLRSHVVNVHQKHKRVRKHVCEYCAKAFYTTKELRQHLNGHLGLRPYVCEVCNATFSYSGAFFTHKKLKHLQQKDKKTPAKLAKKKKKKNQASTVGTEAISEATTVITEKAPLEAI